MAKWEVNDAPGKPADVTGDMIRRADAIAAVKSYLTDTWSDLEVWDLEQVLAALAPVDAAHIRADALREAAAAIDARGAQEQANFGLGRETQNFYRSRDLVRALIATPAPSTDVCCFTGRQLNNGQVAATPPPDGVALVYWPDYLVSGVCETLDCRPSEAKRLLNRLAANLKGGGDAKPEQIL